MTVIFNTFLYVPHAVATDIYSSCIRVFIFILNLRLRVDIME